MLSNLRHIVLLIFTLCCFIAQGEVVYPFQQEIESGQLDKAEKAIQKKLTKNASDLPYLYAGAQLYSRKPHPGTHMQAYDMLHQAWASWHAASAKQRQVWIDAGYTEEVLRTEAIRLTQLFYEDVLNNDIWNMCDVFLARFELATKDQRRAILLHKEELLEAERNRNTPGAVRHHYTLYRRLLQDLKEDIDNHNWSRALETALQQASRFTGDPDYAELIRVLREEDSEELCRRPIGGFINTPGDEYVPSLTGDGNTIYFCGNHRADSIGREDVYVAHKVNGQWQGAEVVNALSTAHANEAPMSVSMDGNELYYFVSGTLYVVYRTEDGWSAPQRLPNTINCTDWQSDVMLTADGRAMLFAAQKRASCERETSVNIFVSLLGEDNQWGRPIDLGPQVNTPLGDRSPFLHPDMKTLYFCSEGHGSLGDYDVFRCERLREDSWTEWSQPVNLGKAINTTGKDCWYRISTDGQLAYFATTQNGNMDLWTTCLPEAMRPDAVTTIMGQVRDHDGQPVQVGIRWENLETGEEIGRTTSMPTDGSYFIALPMGKHYGYYINDLRYYPVAEHIDLSQQNEATQVRQDISVMAMEQLLSGEQSIRLNNLFFATNEATILPSSLPELNRLAYMLKHNPQRVEISGHTDNVGAAAYNQSLSERRAQAVCRYLILQGCDPTLLTAVGYGSTQPVADNATEAGRQANRRVEVRFVHE